MSFTAKSALVGPRVGRDEELRKILCVLRVLKTRMGPISRSTIRCGWHLRVRRDSCQLLSFVCHPTPDSARFEQDIALRIVWGRGRVARGHFRAVAFIRIGGVGVVDTNDVRDHPRNSESAVADGNPGEPAQTNANLSFVHLPGSRQNQTQNGGYARIPSFLWLLYGRRRHA